MDHILATLVGPERAKQLRESPTIDLVHDNLRLVHLSIILHRHRRNELYIELAARPTGEDLRACREEIHSLTSHLNHLHSLTVKLNAYLKQSP